MAIQDIGPSSYMQQVAVDAFEEAQVLILGGAMFGGKSYLAAMLSLLYADNPDSRIAVFRRTLGEMRQGGGIIDTIKDVYKKAGPDYKLAVRGEPPVGRIIQGPGARSDDGDGCRIDFRQINCFDDMEKVRGGAYSLAIIEEATPFFSQEEIEMVMSRLRSFGRASRDPRLIITCNPMKDHFICDLIKDYYLDEEGYAIKERSGHIRYFYKHSDVYMWGDSREEVLDKALDAGAFQEVMSKDLSREEKLARIMSFSFVQLVATDNPLGLAKDPSYMSMLENMDKVKKARNLYGYKLAA